MVFCGDEKVHGGFRFNLESWSYKSSERFDPYLIVLNHFHVTPWWDILTWNAFSTFSNLSNTSWVFPGQYAMMLPPPPAPVSLEPVAPALRAW